MNEFEFPINGDIILQKKRAFKRVLLQKEGLVEKKIAILSGSTIGEIKNILELFLLYNGIKPIFFVGDYSLFYENLVFGNDALKDFSPDIIYIHTSNKNILNLPTPSDNAETVAEKLDAEFNRYKTAWQAASAYNCPIIQNNFELPSYRVLGNLDGVHTTGRVGFINELNRRFALYANECKNFYIQDINYLSARMGLDNWGSENIWYLYKYSLNIENIPHLCQNLSFIIKSIYGRNKKSLILDLDNTLWGGIIGDDGSEGIEIGSETPTGMAYLEFCTYVKHLSEIGVILNVASKNQEEIALTGFDLPQNPLNKKDFACFKANWNPKHESIVEIINEVNILPEAFVFVDDNPAEREIVRENIAGICVPEITQVEEYIKYIDRNGFFETTTISADDKNRGEMYRQNAERSKQQQTFVNYEDYLKNLSMTAEFGVFTKENSARITQLVNKTNQFNLTTRRYTENQVEELIDNKNYVTIYGKLADKFGDNGLVTALIGEITGENLNIDLWIMSCRTFKRNLEHAMMDTVIERCKKAGVKTVTARYLPTTKNLLVADFYGTMGFTQVSKDDTQTCFKLDVPEVWENKNNVIEKNLGE